MRRDICQHDAASANFCAFADCNVAKHGCACCDQNAGFYFGVTVTLLIAGTAKSDLLQNRDIIVDHGGFPDDNSRCVIQHDATPHPASGVNVYAENLRIAALYKQCEFFSIVLPETMRQAMHLNSLKTLQE